MSIISSIKQTVSKCINVKMVERVVKEFVQGSTVTIPTYLYCQAVIWAITVLNGKGSDETTFLPFKTCNLRVAYHQTPDIFIPSLEIIKKYKKCDSKSHL